MNLLVPALLTCWVLACELETQPGGETLPAVGAAPSGFRASAAVAPSASAASKQAAAGVVPALRCGECHEKMFEEWRVSAHREAQRSALFRRLREDASPDECDRCHAPLLDLTAASAPAAADGVSCEVCHRIEHAEVRDDGPGFSLRAAHDVKFGPLCDAKQPYFHRSACSPLFESAALCGSCHTWVRKSASGGVVPVYTEYLDWKQGPARSKPCQSCHMPGDRASIASSEPERDGVPDHGFLGKGRALRGTGATVKATVTRVGERLRIRAEVRNARAGHYLPAGMSGRQLVLRARTLAPDGARRDEVEIAFGRKLVDENGTPATAYRATRVEVDTRLAPRQARRVSLELEAISSGQLELSLIRRPLSPDVARRLGQALQEELVHRTTIELESSRASLAVRLPP